VTLHVCILGIDGSGKSTVTAALPAVLAAQSELVVGSATETFRVVAPDEDHLTPKFCPEGLALAARLSVKLKRAAKRFVDHPRLYPVFKLAQMLSQDSAAQTLAAHYAAAVFVSDGNTFLSTTGRAANYLRAASASGNADKPAPEMEDLRAVFSSFFDNAPVPEESRRKLPSLRRGKLIYKINKLLRLKAVWLPDVVVFLDLSPQIAITRIRSRSQKIDRHENLADLAQAREMYLRSVAAFQEYRGGEAAYSLRIDHLTSGETISAIIEALKPHLLSRDVAAGGATSPLGTTKLADGVIHGKTFNHRYLFRYLLPKLFSGSWREPIFFFSKLGRLFLKEGYSANVMRVIYDRDEKSYGLLDRVFLEYSLHRAVYDRLQILVSKVEPALEALLSSGHEVRILTAPSGFAYDLFRPLEQIARRDPDAMRRVHLVAADLDPHRILDAKLSDRARRLGIQFTFVQGDITVEATRTRLEESAPFDLALFVGLSSWLPKPQTLVHLAWLRENLPSGRLITDSFTPGAYALSGRYIGYKANYYTPEVYRAMLDYCGFDGPTADLESGRDGINHVLVVAPRMNSNLQESAPASLMTLPASNPEDGARYIQ
jgi:thymidylate kinase